MNLKNYTSTVPAERSIANIEHLLARAGATHIAKEFTHGKVTSFIFQLNISDSHIPFKIPAKISQVFERLWADTSTKRLRDFDAKKKVVMEQAERTAWKILHEWVEINISLIQINQVKAFEVFLPYVFDYKLQQTLFEKIEENGLKLLGMGK